MSERTESGEIDVPIEGAPIEYEPPFTSWCSHNFEILSKIDLPGRVQVRTWTDHLAGCKVAVLHFPPPQPIGKDASGNQLIKELPPEPIAARIAWKATGV